MNTKENLQLAFFLVFGLVIIISTVGCLFSKLGFVNCVATYAGAPIPLYILLVALLTMVFDLLEVNSHE